MSGVNNCVYERPNHFGAFNVLREQDHFCDVTIKVEYHEMRAHRFILAGTSNYFHRMFINGFKESNKDVITIEGVSKNSMPSIIEFSYTGKIIITKKNAANLMKDADFLELIDVKDKCAEYLESNIDMDNVCELANLAKLLPGCSSLLKRSSSFIRKNLKDVSRTDAFTDLDFEILKAILSDDAPEISPKLTLDIIINWASGDIEREINDLLELFHYVDPLKLTGHSLAKYLIEDKVQNSLGPKHSEFIKEVLLLFSKSKAKKKCYIFVADCLRRNNSYVYDCRNEKWNDAVVAPDGKIAWNRGAVMYKDKLYAFSRSNERIMYICGFDVKIQTSIQTYTETELPFSASLTRLALLDDCLYVISITKNEVWRFSVNTQTWKSVSPIKAGVIQSTRNWCQLVVLQGHLYAILGGTEYMTIEEYDPQTDKWTWTLICTENSSSFPAAVGLNDKIYLCGGCKKNFVPVALVTAFDLKEKRWIEVASMNTARYHHAAVVHKGKIWVIGGEDENSLPLSSAEVYNPSTNLWSFGKPMTNPISWAAPYIILTNS